MKRRILVASVIVIPGVFLGAILLHRKPNLDVLAFAPFTKWEPSQVVAGRNRLTGENAEVWVYRIEEDFLSVRSAIRDAALPLGWKSAGGDGGEEGLLDRVRPPRSIVPAFHVFKKGEWGIEVVAGNPTQWIVEGSEVLWYVEPQLWLPNHVTVFVVRPDRTSGPLNVVARALRFRPDTATLLRDFGD